MCPTRGNGYPARDKDLVDRFWIPEPKPRHVPKRCSSRSWDDTFRLILLDGHAPNGARHDGIRIHHRHRERSVAIQTTLLKLKSWSQILGSARCSKFEEHRVGVKRGSWHLRVSFLCLMVFLYSSCAEAAQKVGFLNKAAVLESCQAMRSFQTQMEQRRKQAMDRLIGEEKALREEEKDLKSLESQSPSGRFSERLRQRKKTFEKRVQSLQKDTDFLKKQFNTGYLKGLELIKTHMVHVVQDYAQHQGYDLIIDHPVVIYGQDEDNLTATVIKLLDQRISTVDVPWPTEQDMENAHESS